MQIGQTMTAVRALPAGGVVATAGGAAVLLSSSGLLYAVTAFGVIAAGLLLVAGGATGYQRLKPADREPLIGRRFAPVGPVLGHLGLAQIGRTGERGRDRALIGVTHIRHGPIVLPAGALTGRSW